MFYFRRHMGYAAILALTSGLLALTGRDAWSQTAGTIKIVVPYAAGGPTDLVARVLAEEIGRAQGLSMVVEDRPGAGGAVGTEVVARAAPDGNTLLIAAPAFVILPQVRTLNYDALTGFEPICQLVHYPNVIVVNAASPYRTLTELLDAARAVPGKLTMASVGPATSSQIAVEMLKQEAKVDMTFVPYPGYAPAIGDLLGEHVTSVLADYSVVVEQLRAGKLRALAVTSPARTTSLPDVPSVAESGYKDYEAQVWYGLMAPARTPRTTVAQIAGWTAAALQAPATRQKLVPLGFFPDGTCGAEFGAFIRKQYDDFGRIIRETNIKAD